MNIFNPNMGQGERWVRILLGIVLTVGTLSYWSALPLWLALLLVVSGPFLVFEGLVRWCPLKAALGLGRHYGREEA